jgi:hypothetical protein
MILQRTIPYNPLMPRPLPGVQPFDLADWLHIDEAYAGQMARRDALLAGQGAQVLAMAPVALEAAQELLDMVLLDVTHKPGFVQGAGYVQRPDGRHVAIDPAAPLACLGRLVQDDFCILQKQGDEHVLTAAVLCFPASWSLDEKFMRPLVGIHTPVDSYTDQMARRVQRLFDGVQVGRPLWRFNALWYADAELHQPRRENDRRPERGRQDTPFMRSERQCILRLPKTGAVVFSIHTYVVHRRDVVGADTPGADTLGAETQG